MRSTALLGLGFVLLSGALAQTAPGTDQMIEQLRPARTRSLRNLVIEPAQQAAPNTAANTSPNSVQNAVQNAASSQALDGARPSLSLLIQFDFDSARIRPQSEQALVNLAQALQSRDLAASRFSIEGHTDAAGRADYNLRLSQRRAEAVRDVMVRRGVVAARLTATGKGSAEPVQDPDADAAANRRVRIVNLD